MVLRFLAATAASAALGNYYFGEETKNEAEDRLFGDRLGLETGWHQFFQRRPGYGYRTRGCHSLEVVYVVGGTTDERERARAASRGVTVVDAIIPDPGQPRSPEYSWLADDSQQRGYGFGYGEVRLMEF